MDLLWQIFEGSHVLSETSKSKPAINRWRVGFLKYRSKINEEGWGGITKSRLYFPPKLISVTLFCLFLERSEYKLCWAHQPYFSHVHRILDTITPSNKRVCLFSNDFRKCVQVSQVNQWILSQDIQCRHFSNTNILGTVSYPVKACIAGRQDAMDPWFSVVFLMDTVIVLLPKAPTICHLSISGWHN